MEKVPWSEPDFNNSDKELMKQVIDSEWYSQGKYSKLLEQEICKYTGAKYSVFVNNGTSALMAVLLTSGLKSGDEVIVPSFTFIATINSLLMIGLQPVLVDCDPGTYNITVDDIKNKITEKTRGVLIVDVYGMPCDIDEISEFCETNNLILLEDAAEALGAAYKGKKIGGFGHTAIFSFHIAKICTSIEGGAIVTDDEKIYNELKMIREHGMLKKYDYEVFGLNFKSSDINCVLGYNQLLRINDFIEHRQSLVEKYKTELDGLVEFQHIPDYVTCHPYMIFGTLIPDGKRDKLNEELNKNGVDTRICWVPCHKQKYHSLHFKNKTLPNSERIAENIINPPMGNKLSIEQVGYVCDIYKTVLG